MNIRTEPMSKKERLLNIGKPLKTPIRFHLKDCLIELKFGRPSCNQKIIDKWIKELNLDLLKGVPFT